MTNVKVSVFAVLDKPDEMHMEIGTEEDEMFSLHVCVEKMDELQQNDLFPDKLFAMP